MSATKPRLKVLRTDDISTSTTVLTDGQPVYDKETKRLLVGDGSTQAKGLTNYADQSTKSETILNQKGNQISIWTGTQAEYDGIDTKNANTLYFIVEE